MLQFPNQVDTHSTASLLLYWSDEPGQLDFILICTVNDQREVYGTCKGSILCFLCKFRLLTVRTPISPNKLEVDIFLIQYLSCSDSFFNSSMYCSTDSLARRAVLKSGDLPDLNILAFLFPNEQKVWQSSRFFFCVETGGVELVYLIKLDLLRILQVNITAVRYIACHFHYSAFEEFDDAIGKKIFMKAWPGCTGVISLLPQLLFVTLRLWLRHSRPRFWLLRCSTVLNLSCRGQMLGSNMKWNRGLWW